MQCKLMEGNGNGLIQHKENCNDQEKGQNGKGSAMTGRFAQKGRGQGLQGKGLCN